MKPMDGINRRSFLKAAGLAGLAAGLPVVSPAIGLASLTKDLKVAQETRMMMGTLVSVTVLDPSGQRAVDAMQAAFQRMAAVAPLYDRHQASGLVYQLNREGVLKGVPPELAALMDMCDQVKGATGGAFDPSVAPVIDATKAAFQANGQPPTRRELKDALAALGGVSRQGDVIRLTKEGAALTLDGVAKGLVVDQGLAAVRSKGVGHALINAGGDVGALGDRGGSPWRVAVADPTEPTRPKLELALADGAVATSGDYEVYYDRERLYHHIVNPATGRSPHGDVSTSVRAPSAALADALATACFVMDPSQATRFLASRSGLEGFIYTRHGQRYMTRGFRG